jgi:hypothetical protein
MSSLSTVAMPNRSQQRYVVDTVCARARDITIAKLRLRQPFRCFGADALDIAFGWALLQVWRLALPADFFA